MPWEASQTVVEKEMKKLHFGTISSRACPARREAIETVVCPSQAELEVETETETDRIVRGSLAGLGRWRQARKSTGGECEWANISPVAWETKDKR